MGTSNTIHVALFLATLAIGPWSTARAAIGGEMQNLALKHCVKSHCLIIEGKKGSMSELAPIYYIQNPQVKIVDSTSGKFETLQNIDSAYMDSNSGQFVVKQIQGKFLVETVFSIQTLKRHRFRSTLYGS